METAFLIRVYRAIEHCDVRVAVVVQFDESCRAAGHGQRIGHDRSARSLLKNYLQSLLQFRAVKL